MPSGSLFKAVFILLASEPARRRITSQHYSIPYLVIVAWARGRGLQEKRMRLRRGRAMRRVISTGLNASHYLVTKTVYGREGTYSCSLLSVGWFS